MQIFLKDIKIGQRFRQRIDPVFLNNLAHDIEERGLLHPIGINKDNKLIFGRCRIEAHKLLKREKIEANVFDFSGPILRRAEASENLLQSGRSPSELIAIRKFFLEEERAKSLKRMKSGKKIVPEPGVKFSQGKTRDIVASYTGKSSRTLDVIEEVLDASKTNPENKFYAHLAEQLESGDIKPFKAKHLLSNFEQMEIAKKEAEQEHEDYQTEDTQKLGSGLVSSSSIQTYHGDLREIAKDRVKSNSVSLIFTDPMYDYESLPIYADIAKLAQRVLKDGGSLVTYGNTRFIPYILGMMFKENLNYRTIIAVELEGSFAPGWPDTTIAWKPLLWFYKGDKPIVQGRIRDLIKSKKAEDKDWSPNKQSTIEAAHIIEKLTVESELVHDPMMGEGTTALAALQLRRRFVGIEINSQTLKIAKSNIRKLVNETAK
jgi:DNA modification methylase